MKRTEERAITEKTRGGLEKRAWERDEREKVREASRNREWDKRASFERAEI